MIIYLNIYGTSLYGFPVYTKIDRKITKKNLYVQEKSSFFLILLFFLFPPQKKQPA